MAHTTSTSASESVDIFKEASDQYDRYVKLADLGKPVSSRSKSYWAPAPAPLTISAR